MANKSVFEFDNYRAYLAYQIEAQEAPRGYRTRLAEIAGCQPAYLSQVLANKANMTPDQASNLADHWALSELEADYFMTLIEVDRAGTPSLKRRLKEKLKKLGETVRRNRTTYSQPSVQERDSAQIYYSSWIFSAIHVLLTIPALQKTDALSQQLRLPQNELASHLASMEKIGLVQKLGNNWLPTQKSVHAASGTFFSSLHHMNWRMKAIDRITNWSPPTSMHYTAIHTLSESDFLKIREKLLALVDQTRAIASASTEECGATLLIDWFRM